MRVIQNFVFLVFLTEMVFSLNTNASATKIMEIEDKDPEGFFKMFRENPEKFTASNLKDFLKRAVDLYPIEVTYEKDKELIKSKIYKRYFKCDGYYFIFLTKHNLICDTFFELDNINLKFNKPTSSGLQTKLHYKIYLGDKRTSFSFRILYAGELAKVIASKPVIHGYQKSKTQALTNEVARPDSGDWSAALKQQAEVEKKLAEKAKKKSQPAKDYIEQRYHQISQARASTSIQNSIGVSSPAAPNEGQPVMLRKFSARRLEIPTSLAKSPPKRVGFDITGNAKEEIEQQYAKMKIQAESGKPILKKKSSRAVLAEQKQFETKRDEEERIDLNGRRSSITSSSIPAMPTSPRISPPREEPRITNPLPISSPRSKGKAELESVIEEDGYESSYEMEESVSVSQADIQELFEDFSGSD